MERNDFKKHKGKQASERYSSSDFVFAPAWVTALNPSMNLNLNL